jgi:hypothetical protein
VIVVIEEAPFAIDTLESMAAPDAADSPNETDLIAPARAQRDRQWLRLD